MIEKVELTEDEQQLADRIVFDQAGVERLGPGAWTANGKLARKLFEALLKRNAVPKVRLRYFADPAYNVSNSKTSKRDLFLRNSGTEEEMYSHAHFIPYLRYFIFGADLPQSVREGFQTCYTDNDGDLQPLVQLARAQYRQLTAHRSPYDYELPDRFYQLALDCGCEQWHARLIRDAVKVVK